MPEKQIPEEFKPISSPSNSSLSSTTSSDVILINANYMRNSRSTSSVSSTSTNLRDDESIESSVNNLNNRNRNEIEEVDEEEENYQPIKLPTEPTLEELLVSFH